MQRSILPTEYTIIPVYYNNCQFLGNSGKFFIFMTIFKVKIIKLWCWQGGEDGK